MTYKFLVASSFSPAQILAWQRFCILLEHLTAQRIRLDFAYNFADYQEKLLEEPSLVYANPYDSVMLMKKKSYKPLLRPTFISDEVVLFAKINEPISKVEQVNNLYSVACMSDSFIERIGLIILEPSEMGKDDLEWESFDNFGGIFRKVLLEEKCLGIVRAEIFENLHLRLKENFKPIIKSSLSALFHTLLCSPNSEDLQLKILNKIDEINSQREILKALKVPKGFKAMNQNHAAFFSDLMDTLY